MLTVSPEVLEKDPEDLRREEAELAAAQVLQELPEDRPSRLQLLAARMDLFCAATLLVRTKDGGPLWPFVLNPIQRRYLEHLRTHYARRQGIDVFRGIRDLIVKPRQLGFSTFIAALFFMDGYLSPGRITVVLTHKRDLSEELLRTYKTFFESLPPALRSAVEEKTASKYALEVEFHHAPGEPPSRFIIATEAGEPWRGGVIHNLHASEAAFYKDWSGFKASFVQAVPKNGNILYETTVNGFNQYYDAVQDALAGISTDHVVFYPWFDHPEYRLPWDAAKQRPITEEEQKAMEVFGLDLEQLAWRRWKQGEVKEKFPQEYPETLLGAFLTSGRPFFDLEAVTRGHEAAKVAPKPRTPHSGVQVWEDPIPGEVYLLSADVAEGKDRGTSGSDPEQGGSDFSRAYVTHAASLRVVAAIGGRIRPIEYARMIDRVGRSYEACVAVERNNHGHSVLNTLEVSRYPEIYRHREYTEGGTKAFLAAGFPTNSTTRPMILDALDEVIRRDAFHNPDPRFWQEAHAFHRNANGKPEAMQGKHDDRVMAAAIGAYLCTLGRTGWNAGLADGSDSAGFPRRKAPGITPQPAAAPVLPDAQASAPIRLIDTSEVSALLADLRGARGGDEDEAPRCRTCAEFEAGRCNALLCMTEAEHPACDSYWPTEEPPVDDPGLNDGDDAWTV